MNYRSEEMIGIFDNSFTDSFCKDLTIIFENTPQAHDKRKEYQQVKNSEIQDTSLQLETVNLKIFEKCKSIILNDFANYTSNFDILNATLHTIKRIKIQKTNPGEGFHIWHYERSKQFINRVCAFTTYLNTVEEGGETEFLYLRKRINPIIGKTVIFPAGYTHTHRGNPPLKGSKYILTGWIEEENDEHN